MVRTRFIAGAVACMALALTASADGQVERISIAGDGSQADGDSDRPAVSADGSVIAFRSNAADLVAGDVNGWTDVFVRDLGAGTTERVSLQPDGSESVSYSDSPSVSGNGRWVVFENPVPATGILVTAVHDRDTDTTTQILPRTVNGNPADPATPRLEPVISGDARFIAFRSPDTFANAFPVDVRPIADDSNATFDVFVYDRETQPTPALVRVSRLTSGDELDADSRNPAISGDGRFVAFTTYSELVVNDGNSLPDVVLKDRDDGPLELISITPGGIAGNGRSFDPAISADGNIVAFRSNATDLVPGDGNGRWDIFVRDRAAGTTTRVSVASDGTEADHHSAEPSISADGRYVVFRSMASNLVSGDTNARGDVFVHDRDTGDTALVSRPASGESDGHSVAPAVSADGAWIVFASDATNLVPGDTNAARDVFRAPNPLFGTRGGP